LELEKEKEEKAKLATKYETEKDMLRRKAINLKNSASPRKVEKRSFKGLKSPEVLTEEEDDGNAYKKLDSKKIYNKKNIITDINSDIEDKSIKSEISDCTSMSSSNTRHLASDSDNLSTPKSINRQAELDRKRKYQEFVKIMLKVKFEKIHNTHRGQEVSERDLFYECERQNIDQSQWREFIISVLKDPKKAQEIINSSRRKHKLSLK
jgi:hypothetical protein